MNPQKPWSKTGRLPIGLLVVASLALTVRAQAQTCSPSVRLDPVPGAAVAPLTDIRNTGTSRLYLLEQAGRIRIHENGATLVTPFLDITSIVATGGERGLLSLAFHPAYPVTPWFFVLYTSQATGGANLGDVRLARYNVSANPNVADPSSARTLLTIPHGLASNHNGGQLQFGPTDGFLYISVGDGGGGCDSTLPGCNAQRTSTHLGKLLRIDVNRNTEPFYNVPVSNPFVGVADALGEIWATGLRNPFRISFDRVTNNLWIADVGQSTREEIDLQPPGFAAANYGWKIMEGTACNTCGAFPAGCPGAVAPCNDPSYRLPIHDYDTSVGHAIIGGYVYRGSAIPTLRGCYVFGDFSSGGVWAIDPASPSVRRTLASNVTFLTTFGEDAAGELYLAAGNGVLKLVPNVPVASVPASPRWAAALFGVFLAFAACLRLLGRTRLRSLV